MIFDANKIQKVDIPEKGVYEYQYILQPEDAKNNQPYKFIVFDFEPNEGTYLVATATDQVGEFRKLTFENSKHFPKTPSGFNEASKYFEELIVKNLPPSQQPPPPGRPNPIGTLCSEGENAWQMILQDGRKILIRLPQDQESVRFKDNIITFLKDTNLGDSKNSFFKRDEKFFYDAIEGNDRCYGVYPVQDKKGGTQQKNPGSPPPPPPPPPPKRPSDMFKKMARYYGFDDYESLVNYYAGVPQLVDELYDLPITNRQQFFETIGLPKDTGIETFKNMLKNP